MIHRLPAYQLLGQRWTMLVDVTTEIGLRGVGSEDQDFPGGLKRVTDIAEKIVLGADATVMLRRLVAMLSHCGAAPIA